jgi:hypothetical protein
MKSKYPKNNCSHCLGHGFWPVGDLVPIGPIDAMEWGGYVIQCPFCLKGFIKTGERYEALKKKNGERYEALKKKKETECH